MREDKEGKEGRETKGKKLYQHKAAKVLRRVKRGQGKRTRGRWKETWSRLGKSF